MIDSRRRCAYAVIALVGTLLALPAAAMAAGPSGGSGLAPAAPGPAPSTGHRTAANQTAGSGISVGRGNVTVTTTGNGITLSTSASAMLRAGLRFTGTAPARLAGDTIEIARSGHETGWTWAPTASAIVGANGSFSAVWTTNHIGRFSIRAIVSSGSVAQSAAATPALTTTVYRPSMASWYSLYGHTTACGETLGRTTLGVANKTLKCGTRVAFYYNGRTLTVPVVDRGPYIAGRDWDLTAAAASALGVTAVGVAQVGAVSLPAR